MDSAEMVLQEPSVNTYADFIASKRHISGEFGGVVDAAKRHIAIAGNAHKKWAVTLVKAQLEKARLI